MKEEPNGTKPIDNQDQQLERERYFPIMSDVGHPDCPRQIPWNLVRNFNKNALNVFGQNLETLARRGGLHPLEVMMLMANKTVHQTRIPNLSEDERRKMTSGAIELIKDMVERYYIRNPDRRPRE